MRLKVYIILMLVLTFFISNKVEASENKITVVYQGVFHELGGIITEGVTFLDYGEVYRIVKEDSLKKFSKQKIALREFAEDLGLKVLWEDKTSSIILLKNKNSTVATEKDIQLLSRICSQNWFMITSEEELLDYFSQFLSHELSEKMTKAGWTFILGLTDWHWTYVLKEVDVLDSGEDWKLLLATIMEESLDEEQVIGYGLFAIKERSSQAWFITDMKFNWD